MSFLWHLNNFFAAFGRKGLSHLTWINFRREVRINGRMLAVC